MIKPLFSLMNDFTKPVELRRGIFGLLAIFKTRKDQMPSIIND